MGKSGNPPPRAPSNRQSYNEGIDTYLSALPRLLAAEEANRAATDPQRVQAQQDLQARFGPTQYAQQLAALEQIDPSGTSVRRQLGDQILGDLQSGYDMPEGLRHQYENSARNAAIVRGQPLGNAAAFAETANVGAGAQALYQQHLDNAGQFLHSPSTAQQLLALQPISPDRSSSYVNPNAGYQGQQFALNNFQNQLAQYQLAGGGEQTAWQRAARGAQEGGQFGPYAAAGGAIDGAINGPIYQRVNDPNNAVGGTQLNIGQSYWGGAYGGGAAGSDFGGGFRGGGGGWGQNGGSQGWASGGRGSDVRLKTNIVEVGKSKSGIPIITFNYIGSLIKFIGARAQDVLKVKPEAVSVNERGFMGVHYDLIDVPFMEVA